MKIFAGQKEVYSGEPFRQLVTNSRTKIPDTFRGIGYLEFISVLQNVYLFTPRFLAES